MANNRSQPKIKISQSVLVLRFFTIVLCLCIKSTLTNDDYLNCQKDGKFFACHSAPQYMDFVTNTNFTIEVEPPEYTCGNPKSSYFRLGENLGPPKTCDSSVPAQNHPVKAMVDKGYDKPLDISTWWQSITWPISLYETTNKFEVSIVMSFNKSFRMTGDMKIVFNSGRPTDMVLEKSSDYGQTWTPIQYYARDCEKYTNQGIAKTITKDKADAVTCTERYSVNVFNPQPGLQVDFGAFSDRYILFFPNENYTAYYNSLEGSNLLKFLSFTNLKIRLLHPATDARETSRQASDFLRYYYAISNILIEARCFCNLHSSSCTFVNGQATCQCQHFTTGRDCEECLPMYNNKPWKPGTYSPYPTGTANQCEKCECYDHADSCVYNETVSRGVCVNCTHNTTGYSCEDCLPGFFPMDNLALNDSARCVECSCEPLGVTDTTSSCIQSSNILGAVPGQCKCKPLVTGRRCDQCDPEYYGLLTGDTPGTCKMCNCDTDGTVNGNNVCAQSDGQCVCRPTTEGRRCDTCKAGFYNFPRGNPAQNCVTCTCDSGLSTIKTCDPASGVCACKDHASGDKCTVIEANYYVPALDYFLLQPEGGQSADCMMQDDLWTPEKPFDGNEFASCPLGKDSTVKFQQILGDKKQKDVIWSYHPTIRYTLKTTEALEGVIYLRSDGASGVNVSALQTLNNVTIDNACNIAANTMVSNITITLQAGTSIGAVSVNETLSLDLRCKYTLSLTITGIQNSTDSIMIDSAILIPALAVKNDSDVTASFRFYEERDNKDEVMESYVTCVGKVAGLLTRDSAIKTEPCASVIRSVGGDLHDGPKLCTCDPIGTVVNTVCYNIGGQCTCKPGVGGLKCDRCLSGYFNFTVEGCLPCNCQSGGSMNGACDRSSGQCPCKTNVATLGQTDTTNTTSDRQCAACLQNFYGYGMKDGCLPCECNGNGSIGEQCAADGQCPCKNTIGGRKCDICQTKYYQFSANGCISCNCSTAGSMTGACDIVSGNCECKDNVAGNKCDECKPQYFNLEEKNPKGCQPCFCFQHGTSCSSATGYTAKQLTVSGSESLAPSNGLYKAPDSFKGDRHWSYGRTLLFMIKTNGVPMDLKDRDLVRFENEDLSVTYFQRESFKINGTNQRITIPMYEWNWTYNNTQATADDFYRVLSNVTNLYINQSVNGTEISVSQLVLVFAQKTSGAGDVSFVENCTCEATSFVSGSSCERCSEGYRRPNYQNDTSYAKCEACNCNSRGATTLPVCDEWSGVCLNCRNGTMGNQCEACSSNVTEPDCTTCKDGFYGLDKDGCKPCECDPVGSTSSVCNKDTGQCTCNPHVTERQCNECEDNYHNLQSTGCTVCNDCYGLVMVEVQTLRINRDNLTSEIDRLQSNDVTGTKGSFDSTMTETKSNRDRLMTYLTTAGTVESENQVNIDAFKTHINGSESKVTKVKTEDKVKIETVLVEGDGILQQALDNKQRVEITIKDIKDLTDPISRTVTKLEGLAANIKTSEDQLVNMTSSASTGLADILKTIESLENISTTANLDATKVLEDVQTAFASHQNNTRRISDLKKQNDLMTSRGASAITEARDAQTTSNTTYNTAVKLTEELADLENYNPDIATLTTQIQTLKQQAETLKTQVASEQTTLNAKLTSVKSAVTLSNNLLQQTQALLTSVEELYTRISNAKTTANTAKASETTIFQDATNMLETMKNFDTRRQAVEATATESLTAVNEVKKVSEEVIKEAGDLRTSLTTAQQSSVAAKEAARQAYTIAQQQNAELKPVGNEATIILNKAQTELSNLESKANAATTTNTTIVQPAAATCDGFSASLTSLQTKATTANSKAQNLTTTGRNTKQRAELLLVEINKIGDVDFTADTARLARLKSDVEAASTSFTNMNLTTTLTNLKNAVDAQKAWLDTFKLEKDNLQKHIAYIKRLRIQVK